MDSTFTVHLFHLTSLLFLLFLTSNVADELNFDGERYLEYTPSRHSNDTVDINQINIEFRTIHPNGVLVVMRGRGKDTITVQIVQGMLR